MTDKLKDLIKERDKVFVRDLRLNHDKRFDDKGFTDFLWKKYMLYMNKLVVQEKMQDLMVQMQNNTFVPEQDEKMIALNIKDSPQRRWAMLNKEFRDIERKERGGFILKMGSKEIKVK